MRTAVIAGIGSSVPSRVLSNKDLEKLVDTTDEWITTRTGIKERRIAGAGEPLSKFAVEASERALKDAGIEARDLDMIICATVTPDRLIPATGCIIQRKLGAPRAAAFDLQAGCSGFLYALQMARTGIVSGEYRNVLVVGAELLSKYTDYQDRGTCILFADGAGAAVVTPGESPRGVLSTRLRADGEMFEFITIVAGGTEYPISIEAIQKRDHLIRMKGNDVFKVAVRMIEEVSREVLDAEGLSPADVTLFVPHQANQRIIDAVASRMGLDSSKVFVNIDRYGNTSAASIPIALDEAWKAGLFKRGDIVLLAAFGAGLTWAASVVRW
jgi:3-oxoacyl-[acyl-carrier-protein] synthase III